jgi:F420-dependent oxidoreductase-like protein
VTAPAADLGRASAGSQKPRLATYVEPRTTATLLSEAVQQAKLAEELGYESIWVSQLANAEDAPTIATAYACATERVGIGVALVVIYARHPTSTVQMATTVDTLSNGRFRLGLGVGHELTVNWMWGLEPGPPTAAMREYVTIVRQTIREGEANVEGSSFTARWKFGSPRRADLPILIAAMGPRMLELAGELGDGVLLWMAPPRYIRECVMPHVRRGREKAGLGMEGFEIQAGLYVSLTSSPDQGRDYVRRMLSVYSRLPPYRRMLDAGGFAQDLAEKRIRDATVDELCGIGTEEDVRRAIERYREAGCTLPVIAPIPDFDNRVPISTMLEAVRP